MPAQRVQASLPATPATERKLPQLEQQIGGEHVPAHTGIYTRRWCVYAYHYCCVFVFCSQGCFPLGDPKSRSVPSEGARSVRRGKCASSYMELRKGFSEGAKGGPTEAPSQKRPPFPRRPPGRMLVYLVCLSPFLAQETEFVRSVPYNTRCLCVFRPPDFGPNSTRNDPASTSLNRFRSNLARIGPTSISMRPSLVEVGQVWSEICQI